MSVNKSQLLEKLLNETNEYILKWQLLDDYLKNTAPILSAVKIATNTSKYHLLKNSESFIAFSDKVCFMFLYEAFKPQEPEFIINSDNAKFSNGLKVKSVEFWDHQLYIADCKSNDYYKIVINKNERANLLRSINSNIDWPIRVRREEHTNDLISKYLSSDPISEE